MNRFAKREVFVKPAPTKLYNLLYRGQIVARNCVIPVLNAIKKQLIQQGYGSKFFKREPVC